MVYVKIHKGSVMQSKYYICHHTSDHTVLPDGYYKYLFRRLNNEIALKCKTPFKRGDVVEIVDIDFVNNSVEINVVDVPASTDLPLLLLISTTVPFNDDLFPVTESSETHVVIFSRTTTHYNSKFYNVLVSVNSTPATIRVNFINDDSYTEYSAEWIVR